MLRRDHELEDGSFICSVDIPDPWYVEGETQNQIVEHSVDLRRCRTRENEDNHPELAGDIGLPKKFSWKLAGR